jgi:hypothetical protein
MAYLTDEEPWVAAGLERERFIADWREMEDPERAVAVAHQYLRKVSTGDFLPNLKDLELAAEAAWDGPNGDSGLALEALLKAQILFRRVEESHELGSSERVQLRYAIWVLVARAWFRFGNWRQAFIEAFTGIRGLEELAGGRDVLGKVVGHKSNPLAEAAVGFLGLFPAALRRAYLAPAHRDQFHKIGLGLLIAYLGPNFKPVVYARTPAVAAQWFYYLVHDPDADDALLKALFALDQETRPRDSRGLATWDSLAMEYEKRFGRASVAETYRESALEALANLPLLRHRKVVDEWGYLKPPEN